MIIFFSQRWSKDDELFKRFLIITTYIVDLSTTMYMF